MKRDAQNRYSFWPPLSGRGQLGLWVYLLIFSNCISLSISGQKQLHFQNFTQRDGLASNYILSICEDYLGFIWIGTENGLNRFDGQRFLSFRYSPEDSLTLDDNWIRTIFEDSRQRLWIGTELGINLLNRSTGKIERFPLVKGGQKITDVIKNFIEDEDGNIWVVSTKNGLFRITETASEARPFHFDTPKFDDEEDFSLFNLIASTKEDLWITTSRGIIQLHKTTHTAQLFPFPDFVKIYRGEYGLMPGLKTAEGRIFAVLEDNLYALDTQADAPQIKVLDIKSSSASTSKPFTRSLQMDSDGVLSVPSLKNLALIDSKTGKQEVLKGVKQQDGDLFRDFIHTHYLDKHGNYWVGTAGSGLYVGRQDQAAFSLMEHEQANPYSIANGQVRSFLEDAAGSLWVSVLNHGLEQFTKQEDGRLIRRRSVVPAELQPNSLSSRRIIKLIRGSDNSIWIASNDRGLIRMDAQAKQFQSYLHRPEDPNSISANRIWALTQDKSGFIWAGTWRDGLNKLNPRTGNIKRYRKDPSNPNTLGNDNVRFLFFDQEDKLWIGTEGGLGVFDPLEDNFKHFENDTNKPKSLSNDLVWTIYEDSKGVLWIGTNLGLNRFLPDTQTFERYYEKDGLPDNTIYGILEDAAGVLWISTENGLARQLPDGSETTFLPLGLQDGLPSVSFLPKAYLKSKDSDRLFFGSTDGLLTVRPDRLLLDSLTPSIVIHTITVSDPEEGAESAMTNHFIDPEKKEIKLHYPYRSIDISLSDLNRSVQQNHRYEYQLVGLNDEWTPVDDNLQINFTNLSPRTYLLRARVKTPENLSSQAVNLLELKVFPPWWRSRWAYAIYIATLSAIIFLLYRFQLSRQLERQEAENIKALDAIKSRLYANITHEFRTPLTIILGMIEQVEKDPKKWLDEGASMIRKNGSDLLDLINQMLELQKLESGALQLNFQYGDVVPFLENLTGQFQALAHSKEQQLEFLSNESSLLMDFDQQKLSRIVSNLVANAIKYTPKKGQVRLEISSWSAVDKEAASHLQINVTDTGPGIPKEELPFIFDRFFRANNDLQQSEIGTGIGLSLTHDLVKILAGTITVESEMGKGTRFYVRLPITAGAKTTKAVEQGSTPISSSKAESRKLENGAVSGDLPLALVVEDSPEIAKYLQICLGSKYQLAVAENGQLGIEVALEIIPDIIISDVMMPEKDGFELCETLKEDARTSHIPIILLTAKAGVESRIAGLKYGADDYLAKPFHEEELLVRMQNLLQIRRKLQLRYRDLYNEQTDILPSSKPNKEDAFIQHLKEIFDKKMTDTQFDLDALSQALHLSRSQLGRKVKALTGQSPAIFLRSLRLQKARHLLLTSSLSVKEVAYDVGFSDPSYFSKSYSEQFGESPSITGDF